MPAAELRGLAAAVAFLTRIPVGRWIRLDAADIARGSAVFPLVGAGIGAAVGGIAQALSGSLTPPLAAVLGIAVGAALTGALHLDALADAADALGAQTRERALEIMRDHSIGAYGGVALVLDLGAKTVALAVLAERKPGGSVMRAFLSMLVSLFVTVLSLGCTTDSTTDVTVPPPVASLRATGQTPRNA